MSSPPFHDGNLQLGTSYVRQALAFPTTPACLNGFHWNATPWIQPVTIETLPVHIYNRIRSQVRPDIKFGGPLPQLYEFGADGRYGNPIPREVRLLLVFPYLEDEFFEEARLRKWMDRVVIPAISQSIRGSTYQYFRHSSVEMIRLNSQAARVEGMRDVPDTELDFRLQPEELESAWKEIQCKSETPGFEEFRGVRPVIWANYYPLNIYGNSPEAAFQQFLKSWNSIMRMQHIPRDSFYIEFDTDGRLHPEVAPSDNPSMPQPFSEQVLGKRKSEDV